MPRPECQKAYDEYVDAMNEWVSAGAATQAFISTDPIDPSRPQDIKPLPYYEQMAKAYDREEAARKRYFEKVWAYLECEQHK